MKPPYITKSLMTPHYRCVLWYIGRAYPFGMDQAQITWLHVEPEYEDVTFPRGTPPPTKASIESYLMG
jgi:hypothetical protein